MVNTTLTVLDGQYVACEAGLATCDSLQATQRAMILSRDSTVTERQVAVDRLNELWRVAERRAQPGLFGRLRIALPWMAGTALVVLVWGR